MVSYRDALTDPRTWYAVQQARTYRTQVFHLVDESLSVTWSVKDGDRISKGKEFGRVEGSAIAILTAERVALNLMQRMSGIATATAAMVAAVEVQSCKYLCVHVQCDATVGVQRLVLHHRARDHGYLIPERPFPV